MKIFGQHLWAVISSVAVLEFLIPFVMLPLLNTLKKRLKKQANDKWFDSTFSTVKNRRKQQLVTMRLIFVVIVAFALPLSHAGYLTSKDPKYYSEKAFQLVSSGKFDDAVSYFDKAIALTSSESEKAYLHERKAVCFLVTAEHEKLIEECDYILKNVSFREEIITFAQLKNKYEFNLLPYKFGAYYQAFSRENTENPNFDLVAVNDYLSVMGDYSDPNYHQLQKDRADVLSKINSEEYKEELKKFFVYLRALEMKSAALTMLGKYEEAIAISERAKLIAPEYAPTYVCLARIYGLMGNHRELILNLRESEANGIANWPVAAAQAYWFFGRYYLTRSDDNDLAVIMKQAHENLKESFNEKELEIFDWENENPDSLFQAIPISQKQLSYSQIQQFLILYIVHVLKRICGNVI